jgi:STE24 endopeptidase
MHFIIIMAFALVLSDDLPPDRCNLLSGPSLTQGRPLIGTLVVVVGQLLLIAAASYAASRMTAARLDNTAEGHERTANAFARSQRFLLAIVAAALVGTLIFTPWAPLVRRGWHLGAIPLVGDLLILTPFFLSLAIVWSVFYPVDVQMRGAAAVLEGPEPPLSPPPGNDATAALATAKLRRPPVDSSLGIYLLDKFRHQILIIAVPMSMIVIAKFVTEWLKGDPVRHREAVWPIFAQHQWVADSVLGLASISVLTFAPLMLRYIWATEPLPAGPLRDRFVRTCRRIGLRYREILLWHTHGMAINAAVMGFFAPLRYILVSDALLETMDEEEIEAVFGHEAGHVRHWHLQFFVLFALLSMYISGGVFELLHRTGIVTDISFLQLIALAVLLAVWLFGFGWISRRFERQADLYGVRCVTPDIKSCTSRCPVHGTLDPRDGAPEVKRAAFPAGREPVPGICPAAAGLFGRTLMKIADLNGIPKDAPSWRHGSIGDRCRLLERFASDAAASQRFDRNILLIKTCLVLASAVGTAVAVWLFAPQFWHLLRS